MKFLILVLSLVSINAFADVEYNISGNKYLVSLDGIEENDSFFAYGNGSSQLGVAAIDVETNTKEANKCVSVERYEYIRLGIVPQWKTVEYKFCPKRVIIKSRKGVRILDLSKSADLSELQSVLFNVTKPRN